MEQTAHIGKMAVIGMFDGVHRGHAFLLRQLIEKAHACGLEPAVYTFAGHPLETLAPKHAPELLNTPEQKVELIKDLGIDNVNILDFKREDFAMSAVQFITHLRADGVCAIMMGFNNHIGSDRMSGSELAAAIDIPVVECPEYPHSDKVSSSIIRQALRHSDTSSATKLLGHPFALRGEVVQGKQLGRTIGFPTANIKPLNNRQIIPADGAYIVDTIIDGHRFRGIANIGHRPTVDDGEQRSIEVNIIGFDGDLYGEKLEIMFLSYLRPEQRFDSIEELASQLKADRAKAISFSE